MKPVPSATKNLFLFILFLLTSNVSSSKLLKKDMLQFVGIFLDPDSAQKMAQTCKQWRNVKIYEDIFQHESEVVVFRNVSSGEIIWETIKFKKLWEPIPSQEVLVSHLRQTDSVKWTDVFVWFTNERYHLTQHNKSQNLPLLKKLMPEIAANVPVKFTYSHYSPMMFAAAIDDTGSILALIERGADVNLQSNGSDTALHEAASYGSMNVCATLLKNDANIDVATNYGRTPLMNAAIHGKKNVYKFLIKKGAKENMINNRGETASQLARFE